MTNASVVWLIVLVACVCKLIFETPANEVLNGAAIALLVVAMANIIINQFVKPRPRLIAMFDVTRNGVSVGGVSFPLFTIKEEDVQRLVDNEICTLEEKLRDAKKEREKFENSPYARIVEAIVSPVTESDLADFEKEIVLYRKEFMKVVKARAAYLQADAATVEVIPSLINKGTLPATHVRFELESQDDARILQENDDLNDIALPVAPRVPRNMSILERYQHITGFPIHSDLFLPRFNVPFQGRADPDEPIIESSSSFKLRYESDRLQHRKAAHIYNPLRIVIGLKAHTSVVIDWTLHWDQMTKPKSGKFGITFSRNSQSIGIEELLPEFCGRGPFIKPEPISL